MRRLWLFYKLIKEKSSAHLFQLIPENNTLYTTRSVSKKINLFFQYKNKLFQNYFFPVVIMQWIRLMLIFVTRHLVMFLKLYCNSLDLNPVRCLMLTALNSNFLQELNLHWATYNSTCSSSERIETSFDLLFHFSDYCCARQTLFEKK